MTLHKRNLPQVGRRLLAAVALLGTIGGCTALTSETIDQLADRGAAPSGVKYCLPRSMVEFTLSLAADKAQFTITPGTPYSIRDTAHCYYLNYRPLPQYTDDITIEVGLKGYLKSVTANTTDETVEILKNLGKAVGALGAGLESARAYVYDDELARDVVDPTDHQAVQRLAARFSEVLKRRARQLKDAKCKSADAAEKANKQTGLTIPKLADRGLCREYTRFAAMHNPISIQFARLPGSPDDHHEPRAQPREKRADCRSGICYRAAEPWLLKIGIGEADVGGGRAGRRDLAHETILRNVYMFPNQSSLVEIDIRRALLVNKMQSIVFNEEGFLDQVAITKKSELLALSSIPVEVISAVADGLAIRVKLIDAQIGDAKASKALIDSRVALEKQKMALEAALAGRATGGVATTASRIPMLLQAAKPLDAEKPIN